MTARSDGFGERLLGSLLDRSHTMPPQLIAPLIAQEISTIGGRDVTVLLQDYDQMTLVPLPGEGLVVGPDQPIDDSVAGLAFQTDEIVERSEQDGVRLRVPLLDGTDRVGVLVLTLGAHRAPTNVRARSAGSDDNPKAPITDGVQHRRRLLPCGQNGTDTVRDTSPPPVTSPRHTKLADSGAPHHHQGRYTRELRNIYPSFPMKWSATDQGTVSISCSKSGAPNDQITTCSRPLTRLAHRRIVMQIIP